MILGFLLLLYCHGEKVIQLTDETFHSTIESKDLWLVEFYAPWCGHCKQLSPILDEAANTLQGKLQIAKIDVTTNPKIKEEFQIESFPQLYFTSHGKFQKYRMGRSLASITSFAERMQYPVVRQVEQQEQIDQIYEQNKEQPIFFLLGNAPHSLQTLYYGVARDNYDADTFVITSDEGFLTSVNAPKTSFIAKFEKGEAPLFHSLTEETTSEQLAKWVEQHRFPLFGDLTTGNFYDMAHSGKLLVIACNFPGSGEISKSFLNTMLQLVRSTDLNIPHDRFLYGYIDGITYGSFLTTYYVYPEHLPTIIVLDVLNGTFYERETLNGYNQTELADFLISVSDEKEPPRYDGMWGLPLREYRYFKHWYPFSLLLIFPALILLWLCYQTCVNNSSNEPPLQVAKPRSKSALSKKMN